MKNPDGRRAALIPIRRSLKGQRGARGHLNSPLLKAGVGGKLKSRIINYIRVSTRACKAAKFKLTRATETEIKRAREREYKTEESG